MTAPNVSVRAVGDDAGVSKLLRSISTQLVQIEGQFKRFDAATGSAATSAKNAARQLTSLDQAQRTTQKSAASLLGSVGALAAAYGAVRAATSSLGRGLQVNSQLEQSALGIATIITAQTKLTAATGETLEGTAALTAAQGIAADQLQKLRIAGLNTAATFGDLATAFQSAVGPGLAAGLSLDQVREVTVQITQAAGALGVPFNQLSQEVRSILAGEIDINSRVATTLGLTNEQIKADRARGVLGESLLKRFQSFSIAGAATAQSFEGVKSGISDALDLLAADATAPLFDQLKVAGQSALKGIFDLDAGTVAPAFQGIVEFARNAFAGLGDLVASALTGAVAGAKQLSAFVERNRDAITAFAAQVRGAVGALAAVVAEAGRFVITLGKAAVNSKLIERSMGAIESVATLAAGAVKLLADNTAAVVAIIGAAGIVKGVAAYSALATAARAAAAGFIIIESPALAAAAAVAAVALVLTGIQAAVDSYRERQLELNREQAKAITQAPLLLEQYRRIDAALKAGTISGQDAEKAQQKLSEIRQALINLSPEFRNALQNETGDFNDFAKAAAGAAASLLAVGQQKVAAAEARLFEAETALQLAEERLSKKSSEANYAALTLAEAGARNARIEVEKLRASFEGTALAFKAIPPLDDLGFATKKNVDNLDKSGGSIAAPKGKPAASANARANAKAAGQAALIEAKDAASRQLALTDSFLKGREQLNEIAYKQGLESLATYFRVRAELSRKGTDAEVAALVAQRDALAKLPIIPDGPGAGRQAEADAKRAQELAAFQLQITLKLADGGRELVAIETQRGEAATQLAADVEAAEARIRDAQGQTLADRLAAIATEAAEQRKRLTQQGLTPDAIEFRVKVFVDTLEARASLEELQTRGTQALDALGRERQRINTLADVGVISQREAQRQLLQLERNRAPALREIAKQLVVLAATLGPEAQANVARFVAEVDKLGVVTSRAQQLAKNFLSGTGDAIESAVGDTLSRLGREITTLQGAIVAFASSAVQSVQRIVSEIVAAKLREGIGALFAGDTSADPKLTGKSSSGDAAALAAAGSTITVGAGALAGAATQTDAAASKLIPGAAALTTSADAVQGAARSIVAAAASLFSAAQAAAALNGLSKLANIVSPDKSLKRAAGGLVRGPGTSTSDSIPARLSDGEYVINARAVRKIGVAQLDAINTLRTIETHRSETQRTDRVTSDHSASSIMRPVVVLSVTAPAQTPSRMAPIVAHVVQTISMLRDHAEWVLSERATSARASSHTMTDRDAHTHAVSRVATVHRAIESVRALIDRVTTLRADGAVVARAPNIASPVRAADAAPLTARPALAAAALVAASLPMLTQAVTSQGLPSGALLRAASLLAVAATALARLRAITPPAAGFASGGVVRGAGTSTSDSIPARLSVGEYVIRAAAVKRIGVAQLDLINGLRLPIERTRFSGVPRFAEGGFVSPSLAGAPGTDGAPGHSTLRIGLEEGLVLRELNTRAGEKAVIEVLRKNPRIVRALTDG